jgi:hypothetical protein
LSKRLALLRDLLTRLGNLDTQANQTAAYLSQAAAVIDSLAKSAASQETDNAVSVLVAEFTQAQELLRQTRSKIETLEHEKLKSQEELLFSGLRAAMGYQDLLAEANIAVRRELGLPVDEVSYTKSIAASSNAILDSLNKMIDEAKKVS